MIVTFGLDGQKKQILISESVNPRAITTFFNGISSIKDFSAELPLIQMIGEGSVGDEFATLFTLFINNKLDKLVSPYDIINNPNEAYIVGALNSSIGKDDAYRADIASVLAVRLINYCLLFAESNKITDTIIDRLIALTTKHEIFTNDLKYLIIKELLNGNKTKFSRLMLDANVMMMAVK